jgi:RNA polymerase sigma-70 factor (ECF subfamily)
MRELEALYREYAPSVRRWALRLCPPGLEAEDIVHEVFLVARRRLHDLPSDGKRSTWLYRTTRLVVLNQKRRQRIHHYARGLPCDFADRLPSEQVGPDEQVQGQQVARLVRRALEGLSEKHRAAVVMYELEDLSGDQVAHRAAVVMYELEDLSGDQVAQRMDTKLATIWVWLHRGRDKLSSRLRALAPEM